MKNKKDEKKYKSGFTRTFQAGTGLGMIKGNLSPLKSAVTGRANLWHGSPIENLFPGSHGKGILEEGLSTTFAGKNKRLNNVLMTNSLIRDTERFLTNKKIKITPKIEKILYNSTTDLVNRMKQKKDGGSLVKEILSSSKNLASKLDIPHKELRDFYKKELPEMGQRLYFAKNPESVAFWAKKGKNEINYLMDMANKMQGKGSSVGIGSQVKNNAKVIAESLAEQSTGGFYGDIKAKLNYGRPKTSITVKDLAALKKELKPLTNESVDILLRSHLPAKTMGHMKDFPVLRHLISGSPGLKHMLGKYLPQNDPSKDLSIGQNVKPTGINRAEIVDRKTGKVIKRINVKEITKPALKILGGKGSKVKNLKKIIIPGLMVGAGSSMVYNAVTSRSLLDDIKHLIGIEKTSAVNLKALAKVFAVPAGLVGGTLAANYGIRKALKIESPKIISEEEGKKMSLADKARAAAEENKYLKNTIPLTKLVASGIGAGMGALATKENPIVGALGSSYLASPIGDMAAGTAKEIESIKKDPENSGFMLGTLSKIPGGKKFIQDHPELVSGASAATAAGTSVALPYYIAKKYYPYHSGMVGEKINFGREMLKTKIPPKVRKNLLKFLPVTIGLAPLLSYLGYLGTEYALKGSALGLDKVNEIKLKKGLNKKKERRGLLVD